MMKFTDAELVKYADGTLSEERTRLLSQASLHDKELAQSLAALDASCLPYKAAHAHYLSQETPPEFRQKIIERVSAARNADDSAEHTTPLPLELTSKPTTGFKRFRWSHIMSAAACVSLCILLGYWLGSAAPFPHELLTKDEQSADTEISMQMALVERVADYQSLYVANTVKGLLPDKTKAIQLLDAIEQRSGMRTGIPDLSEQGYTFVRAQELGYLDKPLVQLVYSKSGALPLALCYTPSSDQPDTGLTLARYHGLSTASWIARGQQFVLVGSDDRDQLQQLYASVAQAL